MNNIYIIFHPKYTGGVGKSKIQILNLNLIKGNKLER